jgi:hypothetical protein
MKNIEPESDDQKEYGPPITDPLLLVTIKHMANLAGMDPREFLIHAAESLEQLSALPDEEVRRIIAESDKEFRKECESN